ncbi:(2Fe-2S)-binding protein, partial [Candidatus Bathyarchaeota archaeon]|nr:(2Fe-2S)-binding protein [Candidatus Bathyarchaeota archaeon]
MSKGCCGDNLPSSTLGERGTICYCNEITAGEIVKTVKETGLRSISDIKG